MEVLTKKEKIVLIFTVLLMITVLCLLNYKHEQKAISSCMKSGHSKEFCQVKLGG